MAKIIPIIVVSLLCRRPSFLRISHPINGVVFASIQFVITATNHAAMRFPEVSGYPWPFVKQKTALRAGTPVLRTAYKHKAYAKRE